MGIKADIQRELDRREWTPYKLAQEAGMRPQDVSNIIKKDSNPQIDTVLKIADGFGITVDELVKHPKPTPKPPKLPAANWNSLENLLERLGFNRGVNEEVMDFARFKLERQKARGRAAV